MNIFVIGDADAIGLHTVRALTHGDHEVVVCDATWTWHKMQLVDTEGRSA